MIVWFWTNLLLTVLALVFGRANAKAPHRLRFLVCFIALCAWLVPWKQIAKLAPSVWAIEDIQPDAGIYEFGSGLLPAVGNFATPATTAALSANIAFFLVAATVIGLLSFAWTTLRYRQFVRQMSAGSVAGDYLWGRVPPDAVESRREIGMPKVRLQSHTAGAMTTGVFVPTIWVHEDLVANRDLGAVLVHEYRHVRNHDNAFLWVITFVERILWWNPLVRYLGERARQLQELSCDEHCANHLANYGQMLSRLILASSPVRRKYPQPTYIYHSQTFNVRRLLAIEEKYPMKMRHYLSTGTLMLGSLFVLSWAFAQSSNPLSCVKGFEVSSSSTAEEVLAGTEDCLEKRRFFDAVELLYVGGAFATFDTRRVADTSAHRWMNATVGSILGRSSQEQIDRINGARHEYLHGNGQHRQELCAYLAGLEPPQYSPDYMIEFGTQQTADNTQATLLQDFDPVAAWAEVLREVDCP